MASSSYFPESKTLVRASHEQLWSVTFRNVTESIDIVLDVIDVTLTVDEFWSPYVQGTVRVAMPDQLRLDLLDARKVVTVTVNAGYRLAGGGKDMGLLGIGYLSRRDVVRPDDTVLLYFQGKEFLVDPWLPMFPGDGWVRDLNAPVWVDSTPARDAVTRALLACGAITGSDTGGWNGADASWDYDGAMQNTGWASAADPWAPARESPLGVCRDIASRVDGWFRCDETGVWRLTQRVNTPGTVQHALTVGADGTIVTSDTSLSRDEWFNAARVTYTWGPADTQTIDGAAEVTSGDFATSRVGRWMLSVERPWKGTEAAAQAAATSLVKQRMTAGRSIQVEALSAYWLRPGDTVSLQLPLGAQEKHLVSAITWNLIDGTMRLRTRVLTPGSFTTTPARRR